MVVFTRTQVKKTIQEASDTSKTARKRKDDQVVLSKEKKKKEVMLRDERLDKLMPLIVEVITRLLGSAGMMRYRKDLIDKVKEIMNEETKK